jgi:hypothetical protein
MPMTGSPLEVWEGLEFEHDTNSPKTMGKTNPVKREILITLRDDIVGCKNMDFCQLRQVLVLLHFLFEG